MTKVAKDDTLQPEAEGAKLFFFLYLEESSKITLLYVIPVKTGISFSAC